MRRERARVRTAVAAFCAVLVFACSQGSTTPVTPPVSPGPATRVVLPDGFTVAVELATDDATREQGLMYRDQLANDRGMLFLFPKSGSYPFWMKNTLIPLDMIWIDADHKVVFVASDVPPCKADPCTSYGPGERDGKYVLETAAGVAKKHGVAAGAVLRFVGLDQIVVK